MKKITNQKIVILHYTILNVLTIGVLKNISHSNDCG